MNIRWSTAIRLSAVLAALLALNACVLGLGQHRYFTRAQALAFFSQNEAAFNQAAEAWYPTHLNDNFLFNRWQNGRFYWNLAGLQCGGARCTVQTGNGHTTSALPFDAAARLAGVQPQDLRHWMDVANQLQLEGISTIGTALPTSRQYLEIRLRGSSRSPYGFLYIPGGHAEAARLLLGSGKNAATGYALVQPLNQHWVYFEERS